MMRLAKKTKFEFFDASAYRVGLVVSQFNKEITEALYEEALRAFKEYHIAEKNIVVRKVAGCVEIPLVLKILAKSRKFDCLVALGAVIRGETAHFDYVAKIVSEGILRVMLDFSLPVGFGILTTNTFEQARARICLGAGAVEAALQSARLIRGNKY